jgi:high-affinity iron transporter
LVKLDQKILGRNVWLGVFCGTMVSLIAAFVLNQIGLEFEGRGEEIFEAAAMLLAAGILTWMVFWVRKQSGAMNDQIEQNVKQSLARQSTGALFVLAFLAVVREGIELALFLLAIRLEINPGETYLGALLGIITAIVVGVLVFSSTRKLSLYPFFQVTNILLALFAAGLVGLGVHELNELGWIPAVIEHVWNLNPILAEQSTIGQLLKAMVGYKSEPSLTMVIAYFGYFVVLICIFIFQRKKTKS